MKIIGGFYETEEVLELVEKSSAEDNCILKVIKISEEAGWVDIPIMINEKEVSICYSSVMTDTSDLFQFLADIVELKEPVALILDNEGCNPMLYAQPTNTDAIRFLFASDYTLYKSLCNNEIDDWALSDYKIECDVLIDKKLLLNEFYKILLPYIEKYNYNDSDKYGVEFNVDKGKKYLNKIKRYLGK